jgi:hypothetical protein
MKGKALMRGCSECQRGATRFVLVGIAAVLVASLFALPALASNGRDRNGDRIPDRWEAKYDLSLSKNQAPRDQDKDGVKNLAEFKDGTNPRKADTDGDGSADSTDQHPCDHSGTSDSGSGTGTETGTVPSS